LGALRRQRKISCIFHCICISIHTQFLFSSVGVGFAVCSVSGQSVCDFLQQMPLILQIWSIPKENLWRFPSHTRFYWWFASKCGRIFFRQNGSDIEMGQLTIADFQPQVPLDLVADTWLWVVVKNIPSIRLLVTSTIIALFKPSVHQASRWCNGWQRTDPTDLMIHQTWLVSL
jgi:hypothetical protein